MRKKQLNTSVIATFKDGSTKTFDTIEQAAEFTNLAVNSIKSRANKPGSGAKSKDGITLGCKSARSVNKIADANKIDIVDTNNELPINLQAKYTQNMPNYFDIKDACSDKSKPFGIIWKKSGKNGEQSRGTVAVIDIDYFYKLLTKK